MNLSENFDKRDEKSEDSHSGFLIIKERLDDNIKR